MSALRAELLALRTTRAAPAALVATAVLVALAAALLDDPKTAYGACLLALALGAATTAAEYRDDTIGYALLAAPRRWPVLAAKAATHAATALIFGLVALTVALLVTGADLTTATAGAVPAAALAGIAGVALGALARDARETALGALLAIAAVAGAAAVAQPAAAATLAALTVVLAAAATASFLKRDLT